jgi:His-Xaa-Ser system radical SAM maturase HxsC
MKLSAKARFGFISEQFVAQLGNRDENGVFPIRSLGLPQSEFLRLRIGTSQSQPDTDEVILPDDLKYLSEGDMVRLNPRSNEVRTLYRRNSRHNVLFFTERCNSRCLMCSQPPRDIDDDYQVEDILRMIPQMAKDTPELGITGGEPTLLHKKLIEILASTKQHLPATALHMLSNGRLLSYLKLAKRIADVGHSNLMLGIPIYADIANVHDFVVQAKGAFNETLLGILNLGRVGVRVEIRMVIHRETYSRLPQFARFVARNLPFVDQVVMMGLEPTGYARSNFGALWIDPADYQSQLEEAVGLLDSAGINVFVYNHQLCVLRPNLHRFARKSISDWKNIYLPECQPCTKKTECGGFFTSAELRHSSNIRPILANSSQ